MSEEILPAAPCDEFAYREELAAEFRAAADEAAKSLNRGESPN